MKIAKDLNALFAAIERIEPLYLPVRANGQTSFARYTPDAEVDLDTLRTAKSAKDFFFMQTEDLMRFQVEGKTISVEDIREETTPFVAFGVRGCDAKSFEVLDRVFLADPVDTYYQNRREHATVVTLGCRYPEQTCFCATFDIDPAHSGGDVTTWQDEAGLYWNANTEKGRALTEKLADVLEDADDFIPQCDASQKLDLSAFGADALEAQFDRPEWEQMASTCLACGTCTFVCPTCQCYDIRDFDTGHGVSRYRCWDSCMYSDFTRMAHGNPRTTQAQRFRQRFLHKLVYFPANNDGMFSCVGCGRCVEKCPSGLNIVKVIKTLGGAEHDK